MTDTNTGEQQSRSSLGERAKKRRASRHLALAVERSNESWIPANPLLMKKIRDGFDSGAYDLDIEFLISELKTDFALFTYCIHRLAHSFQERGVKVPKTGNPIELLRMAGVGELKQILCVDENGIAGKSAGDCNKEQLARFQEAMTSASVAEILSERSHIDPEIGFTAGLVRQLGLALVAWNYPNIYRREILSLEQGQEIDTALNDALGFSPALLGAAIAGGWGIDPAVASCKSAETSPATASLMKICEIGEALARANNPEYYPDARKDWETAKAAIEETVGHEGMKLIKQAVKENCENYLALAPEVFKRTIEFAPERILHAHEEQQFRKSNRYLKNCPPFLQRHLEEVYRRLLPGDISRDCVQLLTKKIIPSAGFKRGCIFIFDPPTLELAPRLLIGESKPGDFKRLRYSEASFQAHPVIAAFGSNIPVLDSGISHSSRIAGVIGDKQRAGVLYLEYDESGTQDTIIEDPLLYFKAIVQALTDSLNLK